MMGDWLDPTTLHEFLVAAGPWAGLAFLGLQVLQVVIFWIPGEVVQMAGGLAFGVVGGTVLNLVGATLGGCLAFTLARALRSRVPARIQTLFDHPRAAWFLAIVFFLPFVPKDIFCYGAGLSRLRFTTFVAIAVVARGPSLALSSWVGASLLTDGGVFLVLSLVVGTGVGVVFNALLQASRSEPRT